MNLKKLVSVWCVGVCVPLLFGLENGESTTTTSPLPLSSDTVMSHVVGGMDPTLRRIYLSLVPPTKKVIVSGNGRFVVSSVESFTSNATDISSCSYIARKNLGVLLDALGIPSDGMAKGDALKLILEKNTLTPFTSTKNIIATLNKRRDQFVETVFDLYRYVPTRPLEIQGHRVAVFLGQDEQWYVLDPLDGKNRGTAPQRFDDYLQHDVKNAEWFARLPGYSYMSPLPSSELDQVLPFLSSDLQLFFHPELLTGMGR